MEEFTMAANDTLGFGKYRREKYAAVYHKYPAYIAWVLDQKKSSPLSKKPFARFQQYVGTIDRPWVYLKRKELRGLVHEIIQTGRLTDPLLRVLLQNYDFTRNKTVILHPQDRSALAIQCGFGYQPFSYRTMIDEMCLTTTIHRSHVIQAMRNEIQDQIDDFRERTNTTGDRSVHVDHNYEEPNKMFCDLSRLFLTTLETSLEDVQLYRGRLAGKSYMCWLFVDLDLARRWKQYHREHADLRIISREQNLYGTGPRDSFGTYH